MIREYETQYDEGVRPDYWSVNHCQLLAERDLWATRLKMAKRALKLAIELRENAETRNYALFCIEREAKWEKAVDAIGLKFANIGVAVKKHETEEE